MPGVVERFADDLFRRRDHHARDLVLSRLQSAVSLRLDVLLRVLDDALVLGLGLLTELLAKLLPGTVGAFDHRVRGLASIDELAFGLLEASLGVSTCLLGFLELCGDLALAGFSDGDDPWKDRFRDPEEGQGHPRKEQQHQQKPNCLDDEGAVDGQRPGVEKERSVGHLAPSENTNSAPKARLMKYMPSTRPMMMNMMPCS